MDNQSLNQPTDTTSATTPPPTPEAEPNLDALMGQTGSWTPGASAGSSVPPASPPPAAGKNNKKKMILMAVMLLMLLSLPVIYFGAQSVQDTRNRAASGPYSTPTPTNGQCAAKLQACDENKPCCGGQNLVCTGTSGNRVCNQVGGDLCPGGTCGKINAYRCGNLSGGECHENLSYDFPNWAAAKAYTQGCGQVDEVCRGGSRDNLGCGSFEVISSSCGGGGGNTPTPTTPTGNTNTPTHTPTKTPTATPTKTPTPTPTPNPQCGNACTGNAQCPQNHTCSANKCVLTACLQNGVVCSDDKCTITPTNTPTATVTVTYTPTPTDITGQCQNIKIYRNGEVVNPNNLQPGDSIVIAVVGTNATKARIRVNGGTFTETSAKNDAGEYILNFTIPSSGTTTFTIEAELFIGGVWR